jgi:nucleoside-diphosphate-sugar epimerase
MDQSILDMSEGSHDYVYVDDFVEALLTIAFWPEKETWNLVNIGTGVQHSNSEFVRAFQDATGYTFPVRLIKGHSYDSKNWVADNTILKEKYNIEMKPLDIGIKRLVAEFLNGETHRHLLAAQTLSPRKLHDGTTNS